MRSNDARREQSYHANVGEPEQERIQVSSIYLLRHGAHSDVGLRLTGRGPDHGLTKAGRVGVEVAADRLAMDPPGAIYSSPRRRTMETAAIVADRLGLSVQRADAIDEIDFGDWTGRPFAELDGDPEWDQWNASRATARPPRGESMRSAQARALAFTIEAAAGSADRPALLVTHCDIIRSLLCWAERRSLNDIHALACEPASITTLPLLNEARAA